MKKNSLSPKNKKIKSLETKNVINLKKRLKPNDKFNSTFINYNISDIYNDLFNIKNKKENKKEIDILSNANLNILEKLSTFAKEEILSDSLNISPINKKNYYSKLNSLDNFTKLKSKINKSKKTSKKNLNKSGYSVNSQKMVNKNKLKQNFSFHKNKSIIKKRRKRNSVVNVKSNLIAKTFINEIEEEKLGINYEMKTKINYEEFMQQMEIMKINFNLRKNINFLKLKKKISKIKHSLKGTNIE